jgi:hypothetical protein
VQLAPAKLHVTPVFEFPVTVPTNCCVPPAVTVALFGLTVIATSVGVPEPVFESPVVDVTAFDVAPPVVPALVVPAQPARLSTVTIVANIANKASALRRLGDLPVISC